MWRAIARWLLLVCLALVGGCVEEPKAPVVVLLTTDDGASAEARGAQGLVIARLRGIGGLRVYESVEGCKRPGATHQLRVARHYSEHALIASAVMVDCKSQQEVLETFISPRSMARDFSHAIAYWVARTLNIAANLPVNGQTLSADVLARYYTALGHLQTRTPQGVSEALGLLRRQVKEAPSFIDAHAELAIAELLASEHGIQSETVALENARLQIEASYALDPESGLADAATGLREMVAGRYRAAREPLLRAHRKEPGHDAVLLWLGNAFLYSGQPVDARPWLESALLANPALRAIPISLGESDCYRSAESDCQAFLSQASDLPMHRYVRLLLRAHRGEFKAVRSALRDRPPLINPAWIETLDAELCTALEAPDCAARTLSNTAEADLWQLDLGFANVPAADPSALREELDHLRRGGVRLPILEALEACLNGTDPQDLPRLRLLGCERGQSMVTASSHRLAPKQAQHAGRSTRTALMVEMPDPDRRAR